MVHQFIQRKLWFAEQDERKVLQQAELALRTEPLVILGEAGMGKSCLLEQLATNPGFARCTARQFTNRHDPRSLLGNARTLVIDAVDELSASKEGDAVDLVLRKLGALGYPNFVLSCRVADWRSATGMAAIREQYERDPLELHLEPFSDEETLAFLGESLGTDIANSVVAHFNARGLAGLLGNPQTLELISNIAGKGTLPDTRGELFARAIDVLRFEHNDAKSQALPSRQTVLDAAGAAFAALILTGCEAVVRTSAANADEGELQLADVKTLPGGGALGEVLGTRLFKADGADRFNYWHRRIGEYLGAEWLAKLANTKRKQRRLLSLFHGFSLVPASLRGIHACLARFPALAKNVIAMDPMGVIEYGDADDLTVEHSRLLLSKLESLAAENPSFRSWGPYSARAIARPELLGDLQRLISRTETPFGLRMLVLEQLKGSVIVARLSGELRALVLETREMFAVRSAAAEALIGVIGERDWKEIIRGLNQPDDELSVRLAIELSDEIGHESFDDQLIVDLVFAYTRSDNPTHGVLFTLERQLPPSRLDAILDLFAEAAKAHGRPGNHRSDYSLADFAYQLITARVAAGGLSASKLWFWLQPLEERVGYQKEVRTRLAELIQNDDYLRREVQRLVLLETPSDHLWQREYRLSKPSKGLVPSPEDLLALLGLLDPARTDDERWRDIVKLASHTDGLGAEVRAAARPFASHNPELIDWLDTLAQPAVQQWQLEQAEWERKDAKKRGSQQKKYRESFLVGAARMAQGDYRALIEPAKFYLRLYSEATEAVPANERIALWYGEVLAAKAFEGFEEFLRSGPPNPTADEIAQSLAQGSHWHLGYVIAVALAERVRKCLGFRGISDDRLLSGLFELRSSSLEHHAKIQGVSEALESEVRLRGLWRAAMERYHEPQLAAQREHVEGLHHLMRDERDSALSSELASKWLARFSDIPKNSECELIDRLLRSGNYHELGRLAAVRTNLSDKERKRTWDAVSIIVDFDNAAVRLDALAIEPELIWHLRDRASGRFHERANLTLLPGPIYWIVSTFRSLWPKASQPLGGSSGDTNPWDASAFLTSLIQRLGNDPSADSLAVLEKLRTAPSDGYAETIRAVAAEQARIRVEATYSPPTLDELAAVVADAPPIAASDLQAVMIEELTVVQAMIKSDDAESWRGFFTETGVPLKEERCRDHLLGLLRQGSDGITLVPEAHLAGDKEADIACEVGKLRIPIEVKGQWHQELWRGADAQLYALYAKDWRADGRGIYLVLWFGDCSESNKRLKLPGTGMAAPQSPGQLKEMLEEGSKASRDGGVVVFVLDLERPKA